MTSPSDSLISSITAFSRSSNSPRNLLPATIPAMSRATRLLPFSSPGTSPEAMRCPRPSAMAVLPTPAPPMSTGLFFVRLISVCIARAISASLPTTGSSLPSRASWVRSTLYRSSDWYRDSARESVTLCDPRMPASAWYTFSRSTPNSASTFAESPCSSCTTATSRCSALM